MKITIYGAGATGCTLAVPLFKAGLDVTLIARGAHLKALQQQGLRFTDDTGDHIYPIPAIEDPTQLPPQDVVILACKAYSLAEIAPKLVPLLHENTLIIPAGNGIPWWFLLPEQRVKCLDPEGILENHIPLERVVGGLFYMGATFEAPGHISHYRVPRFIFGERDGSITERVQHFANVIEQAGFKKPLSENIREQILIKLCWNIAFNPLSVIKRQNSGEMADDPESAARAIAIMNEMCELAATLHIPMALDIENHFKLSRISANHKPSMLQDFEAGKPLEIDAIVGSVVELSQRLNLQLPAIHQNYAELQEVMKNRAS